MNVKKISSVFMLTLMGWMGAYAQVTIGSDIVPRQGALLDLQMNDATKAEITSTRGLGLPRVELTVVDSLFPMFKSDESYLNGTTKNEQDALHVGLVVYNPIDRRYLCKGTYVWDGTKWTILHRVNRPDITVDDIDGNTYRARWFGDDCDGAYWTIDDMRTKRLPNGNPIDIFVENDPANSTISNLEANIPYLMYPENNVTTYDLNPKLGLFYSLPAALGQNSISDGKDHGNDPKQEKTQGICPDGWHLPSDYEWSTLEKEIALNPDKYTSGSGSNWNDSYFTDRPNVNHPFQFEDSTAWRGTHGIDMISSTISNIYISYSPGDGGTIVANYRDPDDVYYQQSLGKSNDRGFNISLYGSANEMGTHAVDYWSGYWTSSNAGYNDVAWFRFFNPGGDEPSSEALYRPGVKRKYNAHVDDEENVINYKYAFNVRCMKYVY